MNKTVQINLGQQILTINEDAYKLLQNYLQKLKTFFQHEEGQDEIMQDIEFRLADLLKEKQNGHASISIEDVEEVTKIMGSPEQIDEENNTEEHKYNHSNTHSEFSKKSFSRNGKDKVLGGVCGGIARYFDIDSAIIRILLVLLFFGSFGTLFFIYILTWILLPINNDPSPLGSKKIYRDAEQSIIGGVCAGIANYFNLKLSMVRILAIAPFLFSVLSSGFIHFPFFIFGGSLTGTFTLTYIILWISLREAKTPAEKLRAKGDSFKIGNITNEFGNIQEKTKTFLSEAKQTFSQASEKMTNSIDTTSAQKSLAEIVLIIAKAITYILMFVVGGFLLSLLIGLTIAGIGIYPFKTFIISDGWHQILINAVFIILLLSPIFTLLYWIAKRSIKNKESIRPFGFIISSLWFIAFFSSVYLFISIVLDTKTNRYTIHPQEINLPVRGDTLFLKNYTSSNYATSYNFGLDHLMEAQGDTFKIVASKVLTRQSPDNNWHFYIEKRANGSTSKEADKRIDRIYYNFKQMGDTLYIDPKIAIHKPDVYRGQFVKFIIEKPENKNIENNLNYNFKYKFGLTDYSIGYDEEEDYDEDVDNDSEINSSNHNI